MVLRIGYPLRIAVVGYRDSGKTYAAELIIKTMKSYSLKVLAVKHVHDDSFSIDRDGSDSWRMRSAGADASMVVSSKELSIIYPGDSLLNHRSILDRKLINDYDAVLIEGFKDKALRDPGIAKVLCIKSKKELEAFRSKLKGDVIALCSLARLDN
ncbi:MAG: molybdopterin-guanine dinucleotide biosynthesis protein B, partial [Candidatus Bathyarchaeia archaeon]